LQTDRADYQAINVGTGRATSVGEVARLLAEGLWREVDAELVGKYREGDIRHCIADITRARTLLGYEPRVTLEQGIPELLNWVREQEADDRVPQATAELETRQLVR
jgi:dTDP-L-rhamnose 4-epimerase